MHTYTVSHTELLGADTLLLTLEPKRQKDTLRFYPGQYAAISFKSGGRPTPMRCFSMVSSPKTTNQLKFAMRVRGDFTRVAAQLEVGSEVKVRGPFGNFVIDPSVDRNVILIAGGIGITPLMSMAHYMADSKLTLPITLLYSCKSQDDVPFFNELVSIERQNPHFKVIFFIISGSTDKLNHPRVVSSYIGEPQLNQITVGNYVPFTYFICGSKRFMRGLESVLLVSGANPERIITEAFSQASKTEPFAPFSRFSIPKLTYAFTGITLVIGTGFIMALDLARSVPKIAQAATQPTSAQTTTSTTNAVTPTTTSAPTTPAIDNTSSTGQTTESATTSTPTSMPTYQAPTTSVS